MIIFKIAFFLLSLITLIYSALKIKTEIGIWAFLALVISFIWLMIP